MRKIENSRDAQLLFLLCWFAYFTSYIGRLNYSSAMTAMIQEAVLTKSQAGFISMVYFFAYGIGQFCNGMLGDKFHPGKMIFTGLAIAAGRISAWDLSADLERWQWSGGSTGMHRQ